MTSPGTRSARRVKRQVMTILNEWHAALDTREGYPKDVTTSWMLATVNGIRNRIREIKVR